MKTKKRVLPALVGAALMTASAAAGAVPFSGVYVFGDSLSDSGYFRPFLSSLGLPSTVVSSLGRFTTNPGPVWSEIIAQYYGGNPAPSNAGGGIYAQGGARVAVSSTSTPPGAAQRPVSTQITEFLNSRGGTADPNALYAVWAGANDIFQNFAAITSAPATAPAFLSGLAGAEIQQVARLRAAGAQYIMVFSLPDIGSTPQFSSLGAAAAGAATQFSAGFNTSLFTGLAGAGIKVIPVDTFALFNDVRANAAAFGFTNTTGIACGAFPPITTAATASSQFCLPTNLNAANAATSFLFADGVHPTSGSHAVLADFVKSLIDGPNAYSTMAEVPLSSRAAHVRTLDAGLQQGQAAAVGRWSVFAGAEGSRYDISRTSLVPATDTENKAVTVGMTMRASEDVTLGVAIGSTEGEAGMGSVGRFDVKETAVSVFGNAKWGPWYANFAGSAADLKFDDIQRYVKLGNVNRTARANSEGSAGAASLMVGYDANFGRVTVGPFAGVTSQIVTINEFTENGAGSANLNIKEQQRRSRVTSVGLRGSMNFGNWTPFARVSFDNDAIDEVRVVSANPVSVTAGNTYDIPGYRPDSSWVTGTIGVRGRLADRIGLSVVYSAVSSKKDIKQDGITAAVSVDF